MNSFFHIDLQLNLPRLKQRFQLTSNSNRLGIMGPSGFGKSTLARSLVGLEKKVTGRFLVNQKSYTELPAWERGISYVPQDYLLLPHLSVEENLLFPPNSSAQPELWDVLGITSLLKRHPRHLSGGEKQRVALARSLGYSAELVIMDEPFSALDKASRERLLVYLDGFLSRSNLPLIIFSHEERDLAALGCEIYQLDR